MHVTKTLRVWLAAFLLLAVEGEAEALDFHLLSVCNYCTCGSPFLDTDTLVAESLVLNVELCRSEVSGVKLGTVIISC